MKRTTAVEILEAKRRGRINHTAELDKLAEARDGKKAGRVRKKFQLGASDTIHTKYGKAKN
jgi:hypothetical protein